MADTDDMIIRLQDKLETSYKRMAELEAALKEIARQCDIADDPEHHTLGLVKRIAEQALED